MNDLIELRARQQEVGREWQWLQNVINHMASALANQSDTTAFRLLQEQAVVVGKRRVELSIALANAEHKAQEHG